MNKIIRIFIPFIIAFLFLGLLFWMAGISSHAAANTSLATPEGSISVTTLDDELNTDGDCSLREAIEAANTNTSVDDCPTGNAVITDTITFDVAGIIAVNSQLSVTSGGPLVIDGGGVITTSGIRATRVWWVETTSEFALRNITVADGFVEGWGGGLYNVLGNVIIINSTIINNSGGNGGGITNNDALTISNSTFTGNTSYSGAGIFNWGNLIITNSTFSANSAGGYGGGIDNFLNGTLTIGNSTFYGNSAGSGFGGGISINNQANVFLVNTIVANSLNSSDCAQTSTDGGHNISTDNSCGFVPANDSMPNTDPLLDTLQDNGGPTWTHALLSESPAIDNGDNDQCPTTDQRGEPRPVDGNKNGVATCDIGSFEYQVIDSQRFYLPIISK